MSDLRETMRRVLRPVEERMTEPSVLGLARMYGLAAAQARITTDEKGNDQIVIYLSQPSEDKFVRAFKRDLRKRNARAGTVTVRSPGAAPPA